MRGTQGGVTMATASSQKETKGSPASAAVPSIVTGEDGTAMGSRLTSAQVWHELAKASFAVVSYVTPAGAPRSSGVVYTVVGRRLYLAVAPDSWKARHIAFSG